MYFESYGPFEFERTPTTRNWRANFWSVIESNDRYPEDLRKGVGCYAFCIRHGNNIKPWYIGKTTARNGYSNEIFTPHKLNHYRGVLQGRNGTPCIILFPLMRPEYWTVSKNISSSKAAINWLEGTLIGMALSKNPEIANVNQTRFHRTVYVNGIIGGQFPGRPSNDASIAKRTFTFT